MGHMVSTQEINEGSQEQKLHGRDWDCNREDDCIIIKTLTAEHKNKDKSKQTHSVLWDTGRVEKFVDHKNITKDCPQVLKEHLG